MRLAAVSMKASESAAPRAARATRAAPRRAEPRRRRYPGPSASRRCRSHATVRTLPTRGPCPRLRRTRSIQACDLVPAQVREALVEVEVVRRARRARGPRASRRRAAAGLRARTAGCRGPVSLRVRNPNRHRLAQPEPRDVHAEPRAQARGERRHVLQEHRRVLQRSAAARASPPPRRPRRATPRSAAACRARAPLQEHREEAREQRARHEEERPPREHARAASLLLAAPRAPRGPAAGAPDPRALPSSPPATAPPRARR